MRRRAGWQYVAAAVALTVGFALAVGWSLRDHQAAVGVVSVLGTLAWVFGLYRIARAFDAR